jgi:DNA modification methylase/ParB-like chromosome segregation protein Spo0J
MTPIPFEEIEVADRQRRQIDKSSLKELKDSIRENGLLHPIVVMSKAKWKSGESGPTHRLIAGGRRLTAIRELYDDGAFPLVQCGREIKTPTILANVLDVMTVAKRLILEFEENAIRDDLDWKDQQAAIAAIFEARQAESETPVSRTDVAREIQAAAGGETKMNLNVARQSVTRAVTIMNHIHRPEIAKAKSADEAYRITLAEERKRFEAELARRSLNKARSSERLWDLKKGDLREILVEMEDGSVDLVLTDPPYGLGGAENKADSARNFHRYEDSEGYALDLSIFIIQEGWRLTKPKANLFMFCTWKTFPRLFEAAQRYAWTPWYHPLIWRKSGEGEAPWGRLGFVRTYELIFWATKAQKGINGPTPDILDFQKIGTKGRDHAAEKPLPLLTRLIELATIPNDLVLDPCAGSGSTLEAAIRASRRAKGCELDEHYYNGAMSRLAAVDEELVEKRKAG